MSFKDDIKHGAESVKGKAKEAFGKATDDKSMQFDGKRPLRSKRSSQTTSRP